MSLLMSSSSVKALEAAIAARQWKKAVHLLELQEDQSFGKYYLKIAQHYASVQDYQVPGQEAVKDPGNAVFVDALSSPYSGAGSIGGKPAAQPSCS